MPDFYDVLMQHLGTVVTGAVSLAAVLALVWLKKHFVTWTVYDARQEKVDRRFADHEDRLARQGAQIAAVEGVTTTISDALSKLPQRDDLLTLDISMTELRGGLREVNASMQGLKDLVERQEVQTNLLHEHLLSAGK